MTTNSKKIHIELTANDVVRPPNAAAAAPMPRDGVTPSEPMQFDLAAMRARLAGTQGPQFWRSLNELADTAEFRAFVEREFPAGASELGDPVSRRTFLKLMGASLALAGLTSACTYMPKDYIAPYTRAPEDLVPGVERYYATAATLGGYATGVLVESHEGRPTKIEGNPDHPASFGATDIFTQASILTLYDPDRSLLVRNREQERSWEEFLQTITPLLEGQRASQGAGLRLLTGTVTSPTLASQIAALLTAFPQATWHQYEPINRDNVLEGARLAFGELVDTRYDFSNASVVVALDADFLAPGPGFLAYARAFGAGRQVNKDKQEMNRLYVVESTPTGTGSIADHRLPLQARLIESFARALAQRLGVGEGPAAGVSWTEEQNRWLDVLARDLQANQGSSLVLVGDQQSPALHALAHAINAALNNVGTTVIYSEPVAANPVNQTQSLIELTEAMRSGTVELLLILGGNPVYDAPADLNFAERLRSVGVSVHLSLYLNETSEATTWHIPAAHYLETWSDARAFDGTVSIIQPLIEPLYGGKSAHDLLAVLLGEAGRSGYEIVRSYWSEQGLSDGNFEQAWQIALSRGFITDSAAPPVEVSVQSGAVPPATAPTTDGLELSFRPDPTIWDGSFSKNGWLQEIPKTITKLTWDNAALISPRTAVRLLGLSVADPNQLRPADLEQLTLANGQMINLSYNGGSLQVPIWITPGQPDDAITLSLGYGQQSVSRRDVLDVPAYAAPDEPIGFNAYLLRTTAAPWFASNVTASPAGTTYQLVSTQDHWTMEGRDLVRVGELEKYRADPKYLSKEVYQEKYGKDSPGYESLYPEQPYPFNAWGMTINLSACIGCNSCVVACQAENNIPVVGKAEVAVNREMHWIRIDRYFGGANLDNPAIYQQPVTCMQCEKAPCEVVCPVNATVHDNEGINNMVYNRCVGTKYCSNNCPYKVRRFNFFQYSNLTADSLKLMRNPDVTVRNRGVMEKCTYCVQRINAARAEAKKAVVQNLEPGQVAPPISIPDGAVVTACQAACPTQAIVFGDLNDETSQVRKWRDESLNYGLLGELNTQPRTTYIARIRNPNPDLEGVV